MSIKNAFIEGIRAGLKLWRVAAIVYVLQLCLAMTVGLQVYEVLKSSIGSSLEINKLLNGYDHTVISDFLKVHGASITPLIGQLRWLLPAWLFFSVFLDAGLMYAARFPEHVGWRGFWKGGAVYFFPFLKIALFFLLAVLIWTGLVLVPLGIYLEPLLEYFSSEAYSVWLARPVFAVWVAGLALLFLWSVLSRMQRMEGTGFGQAIKAGWRRFNQNKRHYTGLLLLFSVLHLGLIAAYWVLEAFTGMTSVAGIVFVFVCQQAFAFLRVQLRTAVYAGMMYG